MRKMDIDELDRYLNENQNEVLWNYEEKNGRSFLYLHSKKWEETIKVDMSRLNKFSEEEISRMLNGGKNVEQMTRVTGYFSKVAGWNKGKTGELKERHRIGKELYQGVR